MSWTNVFDEYLARWGLTPDGDSFRTRSSEFLPVRRGDKPTMLKIAHEAEEQRGAAVLSWWDGRGAARVLAHDGNALLLERATGDRSLTGMAQHGQDDEATRILCAVAAELHAPRSQPRPTTLIPLDRWFAKLAPAAERYGGVLRAAAATANYLLASRQDVVVLHGDIHHGNVLDFGERGWLAVDPKGLLGERGFDFANIFCNPDAAFAPRTIPGIATSPGRLSWQATVVAETAHLDRRRLLQWVLAYAGLSAAWTLGDGDDDASLALTMAEIAEAELERTG